MAEADIDALKAAADGTDGLGATFRGAFTTLQTRVKPVESQATYTHVADGPFVLAWASGNHHKVVSAGFDLTSISVTGAPTSGTIRSGTLEVHNTGGTDMTVDATALGANGLASLLTIPAGKARLLFITMTGTVET